MHRWQYEDLGVRNRHTFGRWRHNVCTLVSLRRSVTCESLSRVNQALTDGVPIVWARQGAGLLCSHMETRQEMTYLHVTQPVLTLR